MNRTDCRTIKRLADIEAATTEHGLTQIQLARTCHMHEVSASGYLRELIATGEMHICGWIDATNRHRVAVYKWGQGRNVPKPKPRNKAAIQRAWKKRLKADPIAYELFLAKYRARDRANSARSKPQSWLSALGVA